MPVISAALLEQVRERARITDLFEASALQRAGAEYLTRCPWHDDRRPSLTVSPKRNRVHCFVCGKGTDAIGWLQEQQRLSFQEAVLELARRLGLRDPTADPADQERFEQEWRQRRELQAQRERECAQFHQALQQQLQRGEGDGARYLKQRGLTAQSAERWRLGYSAKRLVVPLCDPAGAVLGFTARSMGDQRPKYRNSAADLLFQRNGVVFGLDQARHAIEVSGSALLVEGPLDVIQLHQAGITHAVACLGTSVSELQLALLQRHGMKHLQLAFDGDDAGQAACERLLERLLPQLCACDLQASVVSLPAGSDADALLCRGGLPEWTRILQGSEHWLHWRLERLLAPLARIDARDDLDVMQQVEARCTQLIARLPKGVLRDTATDRIQAALSGKSTNERLALPPPVVETSPRQRAERKALALMVHAPSCREILRCLPLQNPSCCSAMDWVINLSALVSDEHLPQALLQLADELDASTGAVLRWAAQPGSEWLRHLKRHSERELQALMDQLEPMQG